MLPKFYCHGELIMIRTVCSLVVLGSVAITIVYAQPRAGQTAAPSPAKPNILVIWGDDIGTWNISHNNRGMMGYLTPNIDRIAREGVAFTDYYGQQSLAPPS
jgi:hypothetical protein